MARREVAVLDFRICRDDPVIGIAPAYDPPVANKLSSGTRPPHISSP